MERPVGRNRVLVIGLDGASWNLVKPLVEDGKLPTIARLMKNGCYGDLESCIPAYTFPAWKCYSTGKNPGKLGVYWFLDVDVTKKKMTFHNSTSFKGDELWDILGKNDITCGVLDMPTTFPPKAIKGAMVSNDVPRGGGFTYPHSLEQKLKDGFDYKIAPDNFPELSKEAAIPSIRHIINQRFDVASYILKEFNPYFLHLTIFHIDTIQHFYWKEMEENDPKYGKVTEDFWVLIDSRIKALLEEFGDEKTYVLLMSDHGQTTQKAAFNISKWLTERNLLTLKKRRKLLRPLLSRLGLILARVISILARTQMLTPARSWIKRQMHSAGLNPLEGLLDWQGSKVIPAVPGLLYINRDYFDSEEELDTFKEDLIEELREIEDPKTEERLASGVYQREEIYWGRYLHRAPDIVLFPNDGYRTATSARTWETWAYSTAQWSAVHRRHGIFLAHGPDIKEGIEIQGARIYDLTPTILHIFGIPIRVKYQEVDEKAKVKQRIRQLKVRGKF
jgi:predicted AlkP superfamily phosphohydrolase/phosphomutase